MNVVKSRYNETWSLLEVRFITMWVPAGSVRVVFCCCLFVASFSLGPLRFMFTPAKGGVSGWQVLSKGLEQLWQQSLPPYYTSSFLRGVKGEGLTSEAAFC